MIYLAIALIAAGTLAFLYTRKQMTDAANAGAVEGLGKDQARAEYDDIRNQIATWYAGMAGGPALAHNGPLGAEDQMRFQRREIERLAERGAWMMDRIRGLEGAQTGPAQRVRYKMELIEAARRQALQPSERD
ncbi:hypothetical protein ACQ5SO_19025 [Rhodovulum sp. DZ06]|uniref:hypothetical protein n=1 Tax=Rhodovulum sp. DZ06 TaxID=3425126 RepID=UPI003D351C1C